MSKKEKELRTKVNDLLEEVRTLRFVVECLEEEKRLHLGLLKERTPDRSPAIPPADLWDSPIDLKQVEAAL